MRACKNCLKKYSVGVTIEMCFISPLVIIYLMIFDFRIFGMEENIMNMLVALSQMGPATLVGDFIAETIKVVAYLLVIVCAVALGAKLRKSRDSKKTATTTEE